MRPPGFLTLSDIAHWLGHRQPKASKHSTTRTLLARRGIHPAAQLTTGQRALLWRWEDLHVLADRIPRAQAA
ncbi:hypothetical protein [Frankia sp. AgB32]|uniref:hypothetical protein n=1 Tax=Frankia sp. AgB32 TaxID=631119 RepID=UPI00200C7B82|nr:hypothetical protein [Frankia sp. AgB32]MCK9898140.1 hypothetical protein [Frankia sp. AgB32]